jgi:Holliday junction resolvase RusA-like endonuclease
MIDMVIYGTPTGKGRPRFGRGKSGNVITFTPKKTREYEQCVKALAQAAMTNRTLIEGPVKVTIVAVFNHKIKTGWHVSRPDLDNIVKAILDGLNEVVYADDTQVAELVASKKYDDSEERVEVLVETL